MTSFAAFVFCITAAFLSQPSYAQETSQQGSSQPDANGPPDTTQAPLHELKTSGSDAGRLKTQVIPIPVYSTVPNEGATYGLMPVILRVKTDTGRIESIYAPSLSFNDTIHTTATMRYYYYPTTTQSLLSTVSVSTHVNRNATMTWQDQPFEDGAWTSEFYARAERDIFYRFFGLGAHTPRSNETSYTRNQDIVSLRRGLNLPHHFNLGARLEAAYNGVENVAIDGIRTSPDVFPNAPGMSHSAYIAEFMNLRYDTRPEREYSLRGLYGDAQFGVVQGLERSPGYYVAQLESRALWTETDWLSGSARAFWKYVSSPNVPFYNQSYLGGSFFMRGFTLGRFVDQGAWTAEFEQRIRALRIHVMGVTTDWQVAPFVAAGQVYSSAANMFNQIQVAEGVGFRCWVHPNISGRVDVAMAGDGPLVYVELGYPY
jgi:hypothetical protein